MIINFKENPVRDSGVINKGMFEQVKLLYEQDPDRAGELAISFMEQVLTGDHSSEDFMVEFAIANHGIIIEKNQKKWDKKKQANDAAKIEKYKLDVIAEMVKSGKKQKFIAQALGESEQTISYRINNMLPEFPWLLDTNNQKNQKNQMYVNDNVNVNVNVNVNEDFSSRSSTLGGDPQTPVGPKAERKDFIF